jgi:hypothetical protein
MEQESLVIVRLTKSSYKRGNKYSKEISISLLKSKSKNENGWLDEEASNGFDSFMESITNLDSCKPGIYQFVTCNLSRDWETGIVDGYDFKLIPYNEMETSSQIL